MKTTIHWLTILRRIFGLAVVLFSIFMMTENPAFFTFSLIVGVILLLAGKILQVELDDREIRFVRYYLNGTIRRTEVINFDSIIKIEYEQGRTSWEDIFLSSLPSKHPDKLIIHQKHSEKKEVELHFYKSEIRLMVEKLNEKVKLQTHTT